jgi:hypothetical protein
MRLSCPACQAETSLDVLLGREADARAVAAFLERHIAFGHQMVRYIALFRPAKRRLSIERVITLVEELLPDIERGAIHRKGRDWAAPRENWRAAFEQILAKRDREAITLPLTTHGLLYEVLVGIAEKYEARHEAQAEEQRRQQHPTGPQTGPRNLAEMVTDLAAIPAHVPAPFPAYSGPSRAAHAIKAEGEALRRRRQGLGQDDDSTPPQQRGTTA